jgi:group I intron endonuclease
MGRPRHPSSLYKACGVYKIRNLINGKEYIGSSTNLSARWCNHKYECNRRENNARLLQEDWVLFKEEQFVFEVLELCKKEELRDREQYWIEKNKPAYNIAPTAYSSKGCKVPEDLKQKIFDNNPSILKGRSERITEYNKRPEVREMRSIHFKKIASTPEAKRRMSAHLRRVNADPEFQRKQRERLQKQNADPEFQKRAQEAQRQKRLQRRFAKEI